MKEGIPVGGDDKSRSSSPPFRLNPKLPRSVCQKCRQSLCVDISSGMQASSVQGSVLGLSRMDHSFVMLPKQKARGHGVPSRCWTGSIPPFSSEGTCAHSSKTMEESFVMLPPAAASMYKSDSTTSEGSGVHLPTAGSGSPSNHPSPNHSGFYSTLTVLKRAFDIATSQTQVEQPICLECMRVLSDELDKEKEDVNRDIKNYEACLQRLEQETYDVLSDADFLVEKLKMEEEENRLQAAIQETERQCSKVKTEMHDLESKCKLFKELEESYWHEFNDFQFQLTSHQEERDAILAKNEVSQAHLEMLNRTSILNDAFCIWHDGDFGTISNFRLGRLPKIPVEWDEINAAWGQACLALNMMTQYFCIKFPDGIKIFPMGSYPSITDSKHNTYELFGPVNIFWSTRYDKAMTFFLACLKEFAEFANMKDQENNVPPEKHFKLPYKIENDKVGGYTITQSFNKQENWTKALKYTLNNLGWLLNWFRWNTEFRPLSAVPSNHPKVSPAGSLCGRRSVKSKAN